MVEKLFIYEIHTGAGNKISTQTGIGTGIAIAGVAIYSLIKANLEEQKKVRILQSLTVSFEFDAAILNWTHIQMIQIQHMIIWFQKAAAVSTS